MAARDWIERTVDTEGRPCPLRGIPCPGTRKECAFWLDEVLSSTDQNGSTTALQGGCAVLYQYTLLHEVVLESVRTQAAMNTATSEIQKTTGAIHRAGHVWTRLLQLAAPRDPRRELPHAGTYRTPAEIHGGRARPEAGGPGDGDGDD